MAVGNVSTDTTHRAVMAVVDKHPRSNLAHFSFKLSHLVATIFMIFPKLYQPDIRTKIEKTFLVFSSVAVGLFLEWA